MLPYLALGIVLLIAVHFALRAFADTKPETLRRNLRWAVYGLLVLLALIFLRLGLVHYAAIAGFFGFVFMIAQRAQMAAKCWHYLSKNDKMPPKTKKMTKEEARAILGVGIDATHQEIQEAYRRIIRANHPDKGGSEYLASQVNLARDTLLDP